MLTPNTPPLQTVAPWFFLWVRGLLKLGDIHNDHFFKGRLQEIGWQGTLREYIIPNAYLVPGYAEDVRCGGVERGWSPSLPRSQA